MREEPDSRNLLSATAFILSVACVLSSNFVFAQRPPTPGINLSYLEIDFIRPGARPAAMGAAFIGAAHDESAGLYNPAGLTFSRRPNVALHFRLFNQTGPAQSRSGDDDQFSVALILPIKRFRLAYSRHHLLNEELDFFNRQQLSIDSQLTARQVLGGLGNFPGKQVLLSLELVKDNWAIAYEVSKRLSVGFAMQHFILDMNFDDRTFLDPQIADGSPPRLNLAETTYSIVTSDWSAAYQLAPSIGFMANAIPDKLFVGAVANAGTRFSLVSRIFLPEYRSAFQTFDVETQFRAFDFKIPDSYGLGVYYRAHGRLNLAFDLFRIEYSDILSGNDLNIAADDEFNEQLGIYEDADGRPDLTVEDATEVHVGIEWLVRIRKLGLLLPLRFGMYTDPGHRIHAVSENPDLRRLFPEADDRIHFAFGTGFVFKNGKVDVAVDSAKGYSQIFLSWALTLP